MKATSQEYDFHQRILARDDPVAFISLTEWLYASLVQSVQRRAGTNADPMLVEEAVGEALLDYRDAPARYDPGRTGLQSYLVMAAHRDYQNANTKERRIKERQISLFDSTLPEDVGGVQEMVGDFTPLEKLWQIIDSIFPDPVERQCITLILNDVRSKERYVSVLKLHHLPDLEQRKEVQRVKERITKRLRRNIAQQLHLNI